ncbi:MAG: hypothetical protein ACMG57_00310 [Candidatus Dojkabacteria bacterium]
MTVSAFVSNSAKADDSHLPVFCWQIRYHVGEESNWVWTNNGCWAVRPNQTAYYVGQEAPKGYSQSSSEEFDNLSTNPWISDQIFSYFNYTNAPSVEPSEVPLPIRTILSKGSENFPNGIVVEGKAWFIEKGASEDSYLVARWENKGQAWYIFESNRVNPSCGKAYTWESLDIVPGENGGNCE